MTNVAEEIRARAEAEAEAYGHEHHPLGAHAALTGVFLAGFAASLALATRRRGGLPERYGAWDLVMVGAATHKLSRTITKERVTSFIRAPFVRFAEREGHGEVSEEPRGEGLRLAVGELLGCPYCLGQWVAAAFGVGMVGAPRFTRLLAFVYSAETVSDSLQLAYRAAEDAVSGTAGPDRSYERR